MTVRESVSGVSPLPSSSWPCAPARPCARWPSWSSSSRLLSSWQGPCVRTLARQDRVLERLQRRDARDALGGDSHLLAGGGVPGHACRPVDPPELGEARDGNVFTGRHRRGDQIGERRQNVVRLLAAPLVALGELVQQLAAIHLTSIDTGQCSEHRCTITASMGGSCRKFRVFSSHSVCSGHVLAGVPRRLERAGSIAQPALPCDFARYIATSARRSRSPGSAWSAAATAMPMLVEIRTSC